MRWESWSDFWRMGGYGFYVWGTMLVTAFVLALEVWQLRRRRARALVALRDAALEEPSRVSQ